MNDRGGPPTCQSKLEAQTNTAIYRAPQITNLEIRTTRRRCQILDCLEDNNPFHTRDVLIVLPLHLHIGCNAILPRRYIGGYLHFLRGIEAAFPKGAVWIEVGILAEIECIRYERHIIPLNCQMDVGGVDVFGKGSSRLDGDIFAPADIRQCYPRPQVGEAGGGGVDGGGGGGSEGGWGGGGGGAHAASRFGCTSR